jgi:uncharacterized protein with HEPN domain
MQPRRADVYLELALIALRRVPRDLNQRSVEAYLADDYCQSAVERQLEIAGDALGQLRKIAPDLFTRTATSLLDFATCLHTAATLDHKRVYEAAMLKAPELLKTLEGLQAEFPEE